MDATTVVFALLMLVPVVSLFALIGWRLYQRKFDSDSLMTPEEEAASARDGKLISERIVRERTIGSRGAAETLIFCAFMLFFCALMLFLGYFIGDLLLGNVNSQAIMFHRNPFVQLLGLLMTALDSVGLLKIVVGVTVISIVISLLLGVLRLAR